MQHITIRLEGKDYAVRYDWTAIARLQQEIGVDFDTQIARAQAELNTDVLAKALAIGINQPEVTPEFVKQCSPPFASVLAVITDALSIAFHGSTSPQPEEDAPENPPHARPSSSWIARCVQRIGRALFRRSGS